MALDTRDKLIAALDDQRIEIMKAAWSGEGAGTFFSLWKIAGRPPAGANPPLFSAGSGYVPTKDTTGALPFTNAAGGQNLHALKAEINNTTAVSLTFYDRLWACSGFAMNITTEQTIVTPGTLPSGRDPHAGADVFPFLEFYTAPGATAATFTVKGTDAASPTPNANVLWTYTHPANAESVGQMVPLFPSTASTVGMTVPTSFQSSANTASAGNVGITLLRRLFTIRVALANVAEIFDVLALGKPRILDDSCIAMMALCTATAAGITQGSINLGDA